MARMGAGDVQIRRGERETIEGPQCPDGPDGGIERHAGAFGDIQLEPGGVENQAHYRIEPAPVPPTGEPQRDDQPARRMGRDKHG